MSSQSHLYGIEITLRLGAVVTDTLSQSHLYGIEMLLATECDSVGGSPNRTFMELKSRQWSWRGSCATSQSHLYGIEIARK